MKIMFKNLFDIYESIIFHRPKVKFISLFFILLFSILFLYKWLFFVFILSLLFNFNSLFWLLRYDQKFKYLLQRQIRQRRAPVKTIITIQYPYVCKQSKLFIMNQWSTFILICFVFFFIHFSSFLF